MTWLDLPKLALDTETTGIDPETDRIVTVAIGRSQRAGDWTLIEDSLVNPGIPIPAEATKVHGITDEQAAEGSPPAEVLESVHEILTQAVERHIPVVAHNAPFDLTLLDREMRRHLSTPLPSGLIVLDTLALFRRFDFTTGGRKLESLASRHGIKFPAHNAAADALAAVQLLHIIAAANDLLPLVNPRDLHERQAVWAPAQQRAAHYKRIGNGGASTLTDTWPLIPWKDAA